MHRQSPESVKGHVKLSTEIACSILSEGEIKPFAIAGVFISSSEFTWEILRRFLFATLDGGHYIVIGQELLQSIGLKECRMQLNARFPDKLLRA
jgi:hypothetical protein